MYRIFHRRARVESWCREPVSNFYPENNLQIRGYSVEFLVNSRSNSYIILRDKWGGGVIRWKRRGVMGINFGGCKVERVGWYFWGLK